MDQLLRRFAGKKGFAQRAGSRPPTTGPASQRSSERLDALAHADEPEAAGASDFSRTPTPSSRTVSSASARSCAGVFARLERDPHVPRARVLRRVGQALLHDAEQRDVRRFAEVALDHGTGELEADRRHATAPSFDAVVDRRGEAQLVEPRRTQPPDDVVHDALDVVDDRDDALRRASDLGHSGVAGVAHRHRIDLDRVERLAELVVQLARELPSLLLQQAHVVAREPLVGRERGAQLLLRREPRAELAPRLAHAPPREPGERRSDEQQHAGQLVQMILLERPRQRQQHIAQVVARAQPSDEEEQGGNDRQVAPHGEACDDRRLRQGVGHELPPPDGGVEDLRHGSHDKDRPRDAKSCA